MNMLGVLTVAKGVVLFIIYNSVDQDLTLIFHQFNFDIKYVILFTFISFHFYLYYHVVGLYL